MKRALLPILLLAACSSSNAASPCTSMDDCPDGQACLTEFKGGYCGQKGCMASMECPEGTVCVSHDMTTYCFLACQSKDECNADRAEDIEANCSSNIDLVEGGKTKACVPPSGG